MDSRTKKRMLIVLVFLIIFLILGIFSYLIFSKESTCSDGKMNQNEKGVDCGGICSPCNNLSEMQNLEIKSKEFVFGGNDTYDALIKISNPNSSVGSPVFSYVASLKDETGNIIDTKNGKGFILPSETKYIIVLGFSVERSENPAKLDFEISNTEWKEFTEYQKPVLSVSNKRFSLLGDMTGGEAYGIVKNESSFDFNSIKVNIVLRDISGRLMALNTTQMNTVRSGEERDFRLIWPYRIEGEAGNIEVEPEADTYNAQNFIKTYTY